MLICWLEQAVYTVLREAEDRSTAPIPFWEIPIWKDISPKQKKVSAALKLINDTLDNLIDRCKVKCTKLDIGLQIHGSFIPNFLLYTTANIVNWILFLHLQRMVDEEELQFGEGYMNEQDPSILHFLLASGDDVCSFFFCFGLR